MNFFERQEDSRRATRRLIIFFVFAVLLITAAVQASIFGLLYLWKRPLFDTLWADPRAHFAFGFPVVFLILLASYIRLHNLKTSGGKMLIELFPHRMVTAQTHDLKDKQFFNIVEEMSIAAGICIPDVYVLEGEEGINAFAAGYTPTQALVALSQGALDQLTREEIQGVVAHEFSHILNGDMRLNMRISGVLHGILALSIVGRSLLGRPHRLYVGRRGSNQNTVFTFLGVLLFSVGLIGHFFGRLIQAAISRQKEFLADASAVQFTRNPMGIGGALKKIIHNPAGSRLVRGDGAGLQHFYLSSSTQSAFSDWLPTLATHPPLERRIYAISPELLADLDPKKLGKLQKRNDQVSSSQLQSLNDPGTQYMREDIAKHVAVLRSVHLESAQKLMQSLPKELIEAAHSPKLAPALLFALLLNADSEALDKQRQRLKSSNLDGDFERALPLAQLMQERPFEERFALLGLCLPVLKELSFERKAQIRRLVPQLIEADQKLSLFEALTGVLIELHIANVFQGEKRIRHFSTLSIRPHALRLLRVFVAATQSGSDKQQKAFSLAIQSFDDSCPKNVQVAGEKITLKTLIESCMELNLMNPALKKTFMEAVFEAAAHDGVLSPQEWELLRIFALLLDCPLPLNANAIPSQMASSESN